MNQPILVNQPLNKGGVFDGVTFYHWLILIIASCGWLFDCMDQRLFILAREATLREVLGSDLAAQAALRKYIGFATTSMILGWATGGIIFGMLSDKWGRVKTMTFTLLVYSGFTGLSGTSTGWVDFTIYRFLVGLGVGGMFGAATTLVAESVPGGFRAIALGSLQALSATGNILGSVISIYIPPGAQEFLWGFSGWRILFFVGIVPAILVIPIVMILREPEAWKEAKAKQVAAGKGGSVGSPLELFRDPRWRKNTIVGLCLGFSGMVGLWGIGFFSPELMTVALSDTPLKTSDLNDPQALAASLKNVDHSVAEYLKSRMSPETVAELDNYQSGQPSEALQTALVNDLNAVFAGENIYDEARFAGYDFPSAIKVLITKEGLVGQDLTYFNRRLIETVYKDEISPIRKYVDSVRSKGTAMQDVGAFLGMFAFTMVAAFMSRRLAFLIFFVLCFGVTIFVFNSLNSETDAYWMLPMMGFCQLALFGGYSIYFPELFPTRLRGTGVGFCYNTVRFLLAPFPTLMGIMSDAFTIRSAAMMMSVVYLIGIVALIWAPETKGKELPED